MSKVHVNIQDIHRYIKNIQHDKQINRQKFLTIFQGYLEAKKI